MSHGASHVDPEQQAKSVEAGYEITDVSPMNLLVFIISLFLSVLIIIGVSGVLYELLIRHSDDTADVTRSQVLQGAQNIKPLGPPLQPSAADPNMDWQELEQMRADNLHIETSLGTDQMMPDGHHHTRMPVEWAIRLYAKNGIPQNTATDVPVPVGPGKSGPTEYSPAWNQDGRANVTP